MIGRGAYRLSDVSRYTGLSPSTVRSWFKRRSVGRGNGSSLDADYAPVGGDHDVSFLNLVEAYVAAYFMAEGVKPHVIRRAHAALQKALGAKHPFARQDLSDALHAPEFDVLRASKQREWKDHLGRLDYVDGQAARWRIADGVVIDPLVAFGRPAVKDTGVTTFVLANQFRANREDAALVAGLYGVSKAGVMNAVRFEANPSSRLAA